MNKITTGLIGLVVTIGIVAGTAYAMFTSQVTISGFELKTGTAALEIKPDLNGAAFGPSINLPAQTFKVLLPGKSEWGRFWLKNNSTVGEPRPEILNLLLTGRLTGAGGDWGVLKDLITAEVFEALNPSSTTGAQTLNTWNSGVVSLPGGSLAPAEEREYIVRFALPSSADNTVAGKTITNITIEFTGTQE
jgi:hypothetical protein